MNTLTARKNVALSKKSIIIQIHIKQRLGTIPYSIHITIRKSQQDDITTAYSVRFTIGISSYT